jgi:methyl-accepting chemotaxis protein
MNKTKTQKNFSLKKKLMLWIGVSIFIILGILTASVIPIVTNQQKKLAYDNLNEMSNRYANQINVKLTEFKKILETLNFIMEEYDYSKSSRAEINNILKNIIENDPGILGICVAYEPDEFDGKDEEYINTKGHDDSGRFIPYWNRFTGEVLVEPLVGMDTDDWYQIPFTTGESKVFEPFLYNDVLMISFISPIKINGDNNNIVGITGCDVSLDFLNDFVNNIPVFDTGYGIISSNSGILMSHPKNKDLIGNKTLTDIKFGGEYNNEITNDIANGKSGNYKIVDDVNGKPSIIFYSPIDVGKFSFIMVAPINEMLAGVYKIRRIMIALSIFFILGGLLAAYIISSKFSKPLIKITKMVDSIASGNLEQKELVIKSNDEIGLLAKSFTNMVLSLKYKSRILEQIADGDFSIDIELQSDDDSLGKSLIKMRKSLNYILTQINNSVEQTTSGSNQVAQASQSLSQGATEQASSLEEITSSITEINGQSKQNSENAIEASGLTRKSAENAKTGNNQMNDLVTAMNDINNSADEIKKIIKVIDDIAFQTNLLALNANVEAARAGKYGKGFAVVAEEVRNLAGRSADSVLETTSKVEEAIKNIENGNGLVESTAKQLNEIMESASKAADLVEEIATASKEQTKGLDQINQGLGQIDQVTQSNTASAEESASAAEELAGQAEQLRSITNKFKLKQIDVDRGKSRLTTKLTEDLNEKDEALKEQKLL